MSTEKHVSVSHKHFTGRSIPKRSSRMAHKQERAVGKKHCILVWQDAYADNSAWKRLIKVLRIITNNVNNEEWTTEKQLVRNDDGVHYYMIPLGEKHCNPQTQKPWRWMDYIAMLKAFRIETTLFYTTNGTIAWQGSGSGINPPRTRSNVRTRHLYAENAKVLESDAKELNHRIRMAAYHILKKCNKESYSKRFRLNFTTTGMFPKNESVLTTFEHLKQIFDREPISKTMQRDFLVNAINAIENAYADGDCDRLQAYGIDCIFPAMDEEQFCDLMAESVFDKIRDCKERLRALLTTQSQATTPTPDTDKPAISTRTDKPIDNPDAYKTALAIKAMPYVDLTPMQAKHGYDRTTIDYPIQPIEPTLGYNRVVPFDYLEDGLGI